MVESKSMNQKKNTKERGRLRFMIYESKPRLYTAVCLELGLVREGDDPLKLRARISGLARKYLESVIKNNLDDRLLNQDLPAKYEKRYVDLQLQKKRNYENMKKWQKAFETLIWEQEQRRGKLLSSI